MSVLYISYDGMMEPLGQSQVLSYLKLLSKDRAIHLISFEKKIDWEKKYERDRIFKEISNSNIRWHPLRYHKNPTLIATIFDIVCGVTLAVWLIIRFRLTIIHARSYVASVIALLINYWYFLFI